VRLPNVDLVVVEDAKVRDYLLSPTHPVRRFKSVFFVALGSLSSGGKSFATPFSSLLGRVKQCPARPAPSASSSRSVLPFSGLQVVKPTS
jgi:hypothetical protein